MQKNSFVLPTRLNEVVAKLSDKQAGVLFKGILNYAKDGTIANFEDNAVIIAFSFVKQDIDYNTDKYNETCYKRKLAIQKRWENTKNTKVYKCIQKDTKAYKRIHNDNEYEYDNDNDINKKQLLTAPKVADNARVLPKKLNDLQKFSNAVIENFESNVQTPEQKRIWFKRNCRCLTDILTFCNKNIPLALGAIEACVVRLQKANLSGGYEAVCRNLPEYMAQAQKDNLEANYASYQAS